MKVECKDFERILREGDAAERQAMETHAETCRGCREQFELDREISLAAQAMRKSWDNPELWPRIHQALAEQAEAAAREPRRAGVWDWLGAAAHHWQAAVATIALVVIAGSGAWVWKHRAPAPIAQTPDAKRRLLNYEAAREVESAEANYVAAIDKLSKLAEPQLANPSSPLMASYKERLLVIDAAITDCRANIEKNRYNAALRQELLSMYLQKQSTLQDVLREE